jgi:serine/threonine protein kinase
VLQRVRKQVSQAEARHIMRHVVKGIKDIWELNVIHRDMKLANIVLNFPDNQEMIKMNRNDKKKFL